MDQYPKLVRNQWSNGGHNYTLWVAAEVYVLLSEDDVLSLQAQIAQDRELQRKGRRYRQQGRAAPRP